MRKPKYESFNGFDEWWRYTLTLWFVRRDQGTMNYFEAIGVFYAFMDSKPCWQPLNEVWPEI